MEPEGGVGVRGRLAREQIHMCLLAHERLACCRVMAVACGSWC
jgi:hypothetical protein